MNTTMTSRGSTKAIRLLELLEHLAVEPCTATELARRFRVGKRTIQRDLQELEHHGYRLEKRGRRYAVQPTSTALNPVEALAVHSATRLLVHHTRINERHYRSAL
ncbi:MAG: HTH domain-containing protein, partial [Trueperaceae bacterium]